MGSLLTKNRPDCRVCGNKLNLYCNCAFCGSPSKREIKKYLLKNKCCSHKCFNVLSSNSS